MHRKPAMRRAGNRHASRACVAALQLTGRPPARSKGRRNPGAARVPPPAAMRIPAAPPARPASPAVLHSVRATRFRGAASFSNICENSEYGSARRRLCRWPPVKTPAPASSRSAFREWCPARNRVRTTDAGTAPRSLTDARSHPPRRNRIRETAARTESRRAESGCNTPTKSRAAAVCRESAAGSRK